MTDGTDFRELRSAELALAAVAQQCRSDQENELTDDIGINCMTRFGSFDWQAYYVPEAVRQLWPRLSIEARLVAYVFAQQIAYLDDPDV